jgi:hypothetical protein
VLSTHFGSTPEHAPRRRDFGAFRFLPHWGRVSVFLAFLIFLQAAGPDAIRCGAASSLTLRLNKENRLLKIEARNVDLKEIFSKLAEIAFITIECPTSLQKTVTMNRSAISIEDALKEMLRGINHVIFYAKGRADKPRVSKVLVLNESEPRRPTSARDKRLARRLQSYQKRVDTLRRRLSSVDASSRRGKRYSNMIRRLEKTIERLERQRR